MLPDLVDNVRRIGAFLVLSTVAYTLFVVAWAWMKHLDEAREEDEREAEAFDAGYKAGAEGQKIHRAWIEFKNRGKA